MGTRVNGVDLDAGTSGPALSSATPQPLGTATAGVSTEASRADHVHTLPTIPALASTTPAALGVAAVGVGTTAARADHVHALPTIPAVSSATPQPIGTASAGVSADAARADHVHAPSARTDVALDSATGWTAMAGTGGPTATIDTVSEQIELSIPAGAALGQRFALAYHDGYLDGSSSDVRLRLRAVSLDASANDYVQLLLINTAGTVYLEARVDGNGLVSPRSPSGAGAGVTVASILGGQGWLRIVQVGGTGIVYAGVGSGGAPPTTWTACGAVGSAAVTPLLVRLRVGIQRDAAGTGTASADVGDITVARSVLL